jgi:hypothetical protein
MPQAHESDELGDTRDLDRPESESVLSKVGINPIDESVTLLARHQRGEVFEDAWVRVKPGERLAVARTPGPEVKSFGSKLLQYHQIVSFIFWRNAVISMIRRHENHAA